MSKSMSTYQSIETVTKPVLTTPEASFYLNRAQQTLRLWAFQKSGPIQPQRIGGRLGWKTSDVKKLCGVE